MGFPAESGEGGRDYRTVLEGGLAMGKDGEEGDIEADSNHDSHSLAPPSPFDQTRNTDTAKRSPAM